MTQVRVLLFDVMNTLVYDPYLDELPSFFDLDFDELKQRVHPTAWVQFERGELTESEFADVFLRGVDWDYDGLKRTLFDAYRFLPGIPALLDELRDAGITMYSLSNYPVWHQLIEEKLNLSTYMNWDFVSCKTGVRKPDEQAYLNPVQTLGGRPDEFLFVDDRQSNCDGAAKVGMLSIRFEDAAQLRDELAAHGLLDR